VIKSKTRIGVAVAFAMILLVVMGANAQRQMEKLGRGMVAINQGNVLREILDGDISRNSEEEGWYHG